MKEPLLLNSMVLIGISVSIIPSTRANASILPTQSIHKMIQQTPSYIVFTSIPEANATLYAKKRGDTYVDFVLKTNTDYQSYPDWRNVDNPTYAPKMFSKISIKTVKKK